jgi:signal transduction histidine kinase
MKRDDAMMQRSSDVLETAETLPADRARPIFEASLVKRADQVRAVLCFFLLALVLAAPKHLVSNGPATHIAVGLAALFTVWSLFFLNWRSIWIHGQLPLTAGTALLVDVAWLSLFIFGTGGFDSPFSSLLLLVVLFAAAFFRSLPSALALVTGIVFFVQIGFAATSVHEVTVMWQLSGRLIVLIAVAWLAYGLAMVLERERRVNESVIRNLAEGVLLIDSNQMIILANPEIDKICHLPVDMVVGRNVNRIPQDPPYEHLSALLADAKAAEAGESIVSRDIAIETTEPVDLRILTIRLGTNAARPLGWVVVAQDVTDIKAFARMTADGIAVLSHELRSPLSTLRAVSQVLSALTDEMGPVERDRCISAIEKETERLVTLVNMVMDLSALERGTYQLNLEPIRIDELVKDTAAAFKLRAQQRNIELLTSCPDDLPELRGDVVLLEQLLANLCENALKYTEKGGRVEIAATRFDGRVELAVSDDGCGIPADQLERIFEKFAQGDENAGVPSITRGMGLGLHLVRTIAQLHSGDASVESTVGKGSTFRVTLPFEPNTDVSSQTQ